MRGEQALLRAIGICALPVLVAMGSAVAAAERTNCAASEKIVFSCTAGKKTISLCVSPEQSCSPYAEYRFSARGGATTFSYRADETSGERIFSRATVVGASSASTIIWFKNAGYMYEINDPVKGAPSVSVVKEGKQIGLNSCTANYLGDPETVHAFIQQRTGEDYFKALNKPANQ